MALVNDLADPRITWHTEESLRCLGALIIVQLDRAGCARTPLTIFPQLSALRIQPATNSLPYHSYPTAETQVRAITSPFATPPQFRITH